MGSPNFRTHGLKLNLASFEFSCDHEIGGEEWDNEQEGWNYYVKQQREAMQAFINGMDTPDFWDIRIDNGYHEGFQVYIEPNHTKEYMDCVFVDLAAYHEAYLPSGHPLIMSDLRYARKGSVNITPFNLRYAIDNEYAAIHDEILAAAKECGLGEVVGASWCSHVSEITSQPIKKVVAKKQ